MIIQGTAPSQLYNEIKRDILYRRYRMGDKLHPRDLADRYDVSVMPVRDALLQLSWRGLVVSKARVGFYVASYTRDEAVHLMDVRSMYELFCLDAYWDAQDRPALESCLRDMKDGLEGGDTEGFDDGDQRFHGAIVHSANNGFLRRQYDQIRELLMLVACSDTAHCGEAYAEHAEVLGALAGDDRKAAVALLKYHLNRAMQHIAEGWDDE